MKKLNQWWREASPKQRGITLVALIGIVCTGLFLVYTSVYQPASAPIPTPNAVDKMDDPLYYFGVVAKTVAVLLLVVGCAIVLKRYQNKQFGNHAKRLLAVVETTRLSPRQALHLVRVGDQLVLIGATDQNIQFLSSVQTANTSHDEQELPAEGLSFEAVLAGEAGHPVFGQMADRSSEQSSRGLK